MSEVTIRAGGHDLTPDDFNRREQGGDLKLDWLAFLAAEAASREYPRKEDAVRACYELALKAKIAFEGGEAVWKGGEDLARGPEHGAEGREGRK